MTALPGPASGFRPRSEGLPLCVTCCARCTETLWLEPQQLPRNHRFPVVFCTRCARIIAAAEAAAPVVPGVIVQHLDYREGPFADLVVLGVDGDQIRVQALGHPGRGGWDGRTAYIRGEIVPKVWA